MSRPIRILQVVGSMDRGGTETWLMHVLRNVDREQFQMDFLVHGDGQCAYDEEIKSLGSNLHVCPGASNLIRFSHSFFRILRELGPYDVVHSHMHYFSGLVMRLANAAGVRTRIAHSHTNTAEIDLQSRFCRRLYLHSARGWIQRHASLRLAASPRAAACLFGPNWRSDPNTSIVYCGLDFAAFGVPVNRTEVRHEFGFTPDDFIIGHVGRFTPPKNHDLLLRVHAELVKLKPEARLLLIGEGPLRAPLQATATRLGTADQVRFVGSRSDVARLMLGAMDVFVMSSLYEGLGLAAVEAQAAGLPTILSDQIPAEADIQCGLVHFVPVKETPENWAIQILKQAKQIHIPQPDALAWTQRSRFNLQQSIEALAQQYLRSTQILCGEGQECSE